MVTKLVNGERVELTPAEEAQLNAQRTADAARKAAADAAYNGRVQAANARAGNVLPQLGLSSIDELREMLAYAGRPER